MSITEFDIKLMAHELTRIYGKDIAEEIMLKNKDNLFHGKDSVAYALGSRSIGFFAMYYLQPMFVGEGKAELSDTHWLAWEELTDMFTNPESYNKRNYLYSRGFGKTAILSTPTVLWANVYGHSRFTVLGSAIKDTATAFMMSIKEGLSSPRLVETFGNLMSADLINNTEKLELANDSMIMVASTRTTLRGVNYKGNRINLMILDDYMSEINTTTKEARDKHWNIFQRNALPAVEKHKHWIIGFGTTQCKGDFYDRLTHDPTFITKKKPAVNNINIFKSSEWQYFKDLLYSGDDGLLRAKEYYKKNKDVMEYERIWDYFKCDDLAILYFSDKNAFMQEYQLELVDGAKEYIKNIVYTDDLNINLVDTLVIDPATSENSNSDYTAFVVGYATEQSINVYYGEVARIEFSDYIATTLRLLKEFDNIDTVIVEKQVYNGSDVLAMENAIARDSDFKYRDIEFINPHQVKNKQNKIVSIISDINLGRVKFNRGLQDTEAMQQLIDFKGVNATPHDDFIDAVSELIIYKKDEYINNNNSIQVFDIGLLF